MAVETVQAPEYIEEEVTDIDFCSQMGDTRSITQRKGDKVFRQGDSIFLDLQPRRGYPGEIVEIFTKSLFWVSTRKRMERVPIPAYKPSEDKQ